MEDLAMTRTGYFFAVVGFYCLSAIDKVSAKGPDLSLNVIIYTAFNASTNTTSLYLSNVDGSRQKKLSDSIHTTARALFSPDGQYITFQDVNEQQVIIDTTGKMLAMFNGGARSYNDFVWGPNFTIYLCRYSLRDTSVYPGIWRYNFKYKTLTRVMKSNVGVYDHNPTIAPDNTKIAFVHHEYGYFARIEIVDIGGRNRRVITDWYGQQWVGYDRHLSLTWVDDLELIFLSPSNRHRMYYVDTKENNITRVQVISATVCSEILNFISTGTNEVKKKTGALDELPTTLL
jgi:hypothetical protein